jgi:class 3 adenylate cyclase/TolB-like protein/cytochrome c-type biogenesis protein CcmH/NrfG
MTQEAVTAQIERRLAAILAADVVAYSRLMGADEEGTLARLKSLRRELIDPSISQYRGRIVKTTGDGMLVEFSSVVDALRCAVEVQRGMAERNTEAPTDRRIEFRIGINLGDVMMDAGDIYGDGVNIAARLEGIAEPGGIALSASAHDQVRGKVDVAFADLGDQKLKNIERPVRTFRVILQAPRATFLSRLPPLGGKVGAAVLAGALALLAIGGGTAWWRQAARHGVLESSQPAQPSAMRTVPPLSQRPTVAVLPFSNLSTQPGDDYFSDGLTEDIISALGRFSELGVLARNAVLAYKDKQLRTEDLRRELGARYLVQGTVRRSPEHVRVTVQLADASDGRLLWSTQYDTEPKGIFSIQDDITRQIAGALAVRLTKLEQERSAAKPPNNLEAYDLVLQGRQRMMARDTRAANVEARSLFQRAIAIDPNYISAYIGLGESYLISALRGWSDQPEETLKRAQSLATTAIAVDSSSPGAHSLLGSVDVLFRQYDQAIDELNLAIDLNPSGAETYGWLGNALLFAGNLEQAIDSGETALHFDPNLNVHHLWPLGTAYFLAGRAADGTRLMEQIVTRYPEYVFAHVILVAAYTESGRTEEAARARAQVRKLDPFFNTFYFVSLFRNSDHRVELQNALLKAGL